jgi:hypothetical protein
LNTTGRTVPTKLTDRSQCGIDPPPETGMDNILAKLGVATRGEAAATASRLHLAG